MQEQSTGSVSIRSLSTMISWDRSTECGDAAFEFSLRRHEVAVDEGRCFLSFVQVTRVQSTAVSGTQPGVLKLSCLITD